MTPDELRALADALPEGVHWSDPITPDMLAEAIKRFCADAQPVAWMYEHDGCVDTPLFTVNRWTKCEEPWNESPLFLHPAPAVPAGWKLVPVEPTPEMLSAVGMMDGYDWHAPGCSPDADHANWYSAMIAAAPAAPQAEPKREDQPLRDLLAVIHCDGGHHTEAVGIEQSIKDAQAAVCELKRELAMEKREPLNDERIIEIQRAAYERAARECENRAGRTTLRAYPHYLECAAAIRALGRQHD